VSRSENTCSGHVHILPFVVIAVIIIVFLFYRSPFSISSVRSSVLVFFPPTTVVKLGSSASSEMPPDG